jgi:large subunit ribosomal protein L9
MEVILLRSHQKLGKFGETVDVAPGYFRNCLHGNGIALPATKSNMEIFEKQKAELEVNNLRAKKRAEEVAEKINGAIFSFVKQCGDDGKLYGSLSVKEVAKEIKDKFNVEVKSNNIKFAEPVKVTKIYKAFLSLHNEVSIEILLNVARTESEAAEAVRVYKEKIEKEAMAKEEKDSGFDSDLSASAAAS